MKVLVTGATGFTGSHLARRLAASGRDVRVFVRCSEDSPPAVALAGLGIEISRGDITDPDAVDRAVRGCETVYHIAAVYRTAGHPDKLYERVNVKGTANVIAAARRRSARLVHCSTVGVHGRIAAQNVPASETAPFNPGDVYQRTKLEGERLVHRAIADGFPATIFRPCGIYGPGDLRFLKLFRAIYKGTFRMFGSGETLYHLTYIDDLVEGIIRCGECDRALGQTYILAGPRYTTLSELVSRIAKAMNVPSPVGRLPLWPLLTAATACEFLCLRLGIEPPLHRRRVDFFRKDRAFCIDKANRELGFEPTIDLDVGLARTAEAYMREGRLKPHRHTASSSVCSLPGAPSITSADVALPPSGTVEPTSSESTLAQVQRSSSIYDLDRG